MIFRVADISLREICSHFANRVLLTLSLDYDIYAFTKRFVMVWFCHTHCFSFKFGGDVVIVSGLPVESVPQCILGM